MKNEELRNFVVVRNILHNKEAKNTPLSRTHPLIPSQEGSHSKNNPLSRTHPLIPSQEGSHSKNSLLEKGWRCLSSVFSYFVFRNSQSAIRNSSFRNPALHAFGEIRNSFSLPLLRFNCAGSGNVGVAAVGGHHHFKGVFVARFPLSADEWGFGDVWNRSTAPREFAYDSI